jgi:uncharacterized protein YkwD
MLVEVNQQRANNGAGPLQIDMNLQFATRRHAWTMATQHSMYHPANCGRENVACGQATCDSAIRTWMNSSGHRANLLYRGATRLGITGYVSSSGRCYWCMRVR